MNELAKYEQIKDSRIAVVIARILEGASLKDSVHEAGLTMQLFTYHLASDKTAAVAYARSVEVKADIMADETIKIADSNGDPAKVRNQIQARQWLASKLNKTYNDRIDLNVNQNLDITSTLAAARARLLPTRDLQNVTDAETLSPVGLALQRAHDKKSDAPFNDPAAAPDIFS